MSKKNEIIRNIENKIDEVDRELSSLDTKLEKANEDVRHTWESNKLELREKRSELSHRLQEAQNASEDMLDEIQSQVKGLADSIESGFKSIKDKLVS
ncbi:conserved hypothetical protein [gamma proteobacterium HTCC5015]|nr:conserved hypothetical protein [gamma proteobacterium HTCC5015]